jgi:hypothetical protein
MTYNEARRAGGELARRLDKMLQVPGNHHWSAKVWAGDSVLVRPKRQWHYAARWGVVEGYAAEVEVYPSFWRGKRAGQLAGFMAYVRTPRGRVSHAGRTPEAAVRGAMKLVVAQIKQLTDALLPLAMYMDRAMYRRLAGGGVAQPSASDSGMMRA